MAKVENSIYIDASPERVWDMMNNLNRKTEYVHFVKEVFDISSGDVQIGTKYRERAQFGPRVSVSEWTFSEFEAPSHQVQVSESGEMRASFTGNLSPEGNGTRLVVEMEVCLLPVFRPLGWFIEKVFAQRKMESDIAETLSSLKTLVENEAK